MGRIAGALLAVLALGGALAWWLGSSPATVRVEETPDGDAATGPRPQGAEPLLRAGAGERRRVPSAEEAPGVLSPAFSPRRRLTVDVAWGVVVDERGTPVPGAVVESGWVDQRGNPGFEVGARGTTDDAGRYVLPDLAERPFLRRVLRASAPGRLSETEEFVTHRFASLRVFPSVRVTGQVLDAVTGRALAGASVLEWGLPGGGWLAAVESGADGRFRILTPRREVSVSAWKEGYEFDRTWVSAEAGSDVEVVVRLAPAATRLVRGRLVEGDLPVSGGLVELLDVSREEAAPPVASVRTDGEGRFDLRIVVGRDYALQARVGDRRAFGIVRASEWPQDEVRDVPLRPPLALVGRVETRDGRPVPGALLEIEREAPREVRRARTDDEGRYRFEDVRRPERYVHLRLRLREARGHRVSVERSVEVASGSGPEVEAGTIVMETGPLRGRVRDAKGRGIEGALVGPAGETALAVAGADGAWEIASYGQPLVLQASAPGYVPAEFVAFQVAEGASLDVTLARGGSLAGRVVDEAGAPLHARVRVLDADPPLSAVTRPDGTWRVDGVVGTALGVRVDCDGFLPAERTGLPPDAVIPDVVLRRE